MLNKANIKNIIEEHQKEIDEIEREIKKTSSDTVKNILNGRLSYLKDNQYRYRLQAKAWGIIV